MTTHPGSTPRSIRRPGWSGKGAVRPSGDVLRRHRGWAVAGHAGVRRGACPFDERAHDGRQVEPEQVSGDLLELNQGTIYPALLKLEQMRWIRTKWSTSENNRRAKYYSLTAAGKKQLAREEEEWHRTSAIVTRFLTPSED